MSKVNDEAVEIEVPLLLEWMKQGEQSNELRELKNKLGAAGVDVSSLGIEQLTSYDRYENPPFYYIFRAPTSHETALSLWEQLRNLVDETGYCPIISVGESLEWSPPYGYPSYDDPKYDDSELSEPKEKQIQRFQNFIQQAELLDTNDWFAVQKAEKGREWENPAVLNRLRNWLTGLKQLTDDPLILDRLRNYEREENQTWPALLDVLGNYEEGMPWVLWGIGAQPSAVQWVEDRQRWLLNKFDHWPQVEPSKAIVIPSMVPLCINFLPTKVSWHILGMLPLSSLGANYNLDPITHMAILKRWYTAYGAELVFVTGAKIALKVSKPPTSKEAAMQLAIEHYLYCPDVLNIKERAAKILNRHAWHFWWD